MSQNKKFVVITSINPPGEAIEKFARWQDWEIIVVGDRKTPGNWSHAGVTFLGMDSQYDLFDEFAHSIPENTYTRKTIGYLYAIRNGADLIFESDDDNIPYDFARDEIQKEAASPQRRECISTNDQWVNTYKIFGAH